MSNVSSYVGKKRRVSARCSPLTFIKSIPTQARAKYLRTIESPYNGERLQSQAHAMFLQTFYGVKVRLANPDGNTEIEIQQYNTSSKVTVKDLEEEMKKHGRK